MNNPLPFRLLPAALAAILVSACAPSRMALPPTLSKEAKPMPVQKTYSFWIFGLKKLDFGGYKVTDYHTGWQSGSATGIDAGKVGYKADKSEQKFEFKLSPKEGPAWAGRCTEAASKRTVSGKLLGGLSADLERQATLECTFQLEQGNAPWTMALSLQSAGSGMLAKEMLGGELSDGSRKLKVEGISEMEGLANGNGEATGFAIKDDAKVLGAVQVIDKPLVWMDPAAQADLGAPMALASTALMLQKGLLKQLESK
jgi:hypothetical protein